MIFEQQSFYRVADEVISPVLDILMLVPAPAIIKQATVDTNIVLPMTTKVCAYLCCDFFVIYSLSTQEYEDYTAAHRLKSDRVVVMVPLILYSDDTSGNRSKRWNKFDSWCLKLAGLPNEMNQQLHHIHLLCSSNKVESITLLHQI